MSFLRLTLVGIICLINVLTIQSATIRIMGVGDSITQGGETFTSYMGPLAKLMSAAGFDYEFVGTRDGFSDGIHYKHAAFGGQNAEYVCGVLDSIYQVYPADIVLIHAGHNHFIEEKPVKGIVESHCSMIQKIRDINPDAVILVAGVIESGKLPKYSYLPDLNIMLGKMIRKLNDPKIRYVSVGDGFDWQIHTIDDKVHPNTVGAYVMACNWFKVLNRILLSMQPER